MISDNFVLTYYWAKIILSIVASFVNAGFSDFFLKVLLMFVICCVNWN